MKLAASAASQKSQSGCRDEYRLIFACPAASRLSEFSDSVDGVRVDNTLLLQQHVSDRSESNCPNQKHIILLIVLKGTSFEQAGQQADKQASKQAQKKAGKQASSKASGAQNLLC